MVRDEAPEPEHIRPWKKAKWHLFTDHLARAEMVIPQVVTIKKLDKMTDRLYDVLQGALDKACPLQPPAGLVKSNKWFTEELGKVRKNVRKLYSKMKRTKKEGDKKRFHAAKKLYQKKCAAAKTRSWRYFVETTPNESKMAVLNKIIQNKARNSVYTLQKPNGEDTEPGLETLKLLACLLYTSPSPRDLSTSRMPSSA